MTQACNDPVIHNQWHPLTSLDEIAQGLVHDTVLLEQPSILRDGRCGRATCLAPNTRTARSHAL